MIKKKYLISLVISLLSLGINAKDLYGSFNGGKASFKVTNNVLDIYDNAKLVNKIEIPSGYNIRNLVVSDDFGYVLIQNRNELIIFDNKSKTFVPTDLKLNSNITAGQSSGAKGFMFGDEVGNVFQLYPTQKEFILAPLITDGVKLPLKSIKKINDVNYIFEWQKDLNTKVGFKYSNDLINDRIGNEVGLGYKPTTALNEFENSIATIGSKEVGFIKTTETLNYPKPPSVEPPRLNRMRITQIDNGKFLNLLTLDDQVIRSLPGNIYVSSNKLNNQTTIIDFEKLLKTLDPKASSTVINSTYDFVEYNKSEIIFGKADSSKIEKFDLKSKKIKRKTLSMKVGGIIPAEDGFYVLSKNGELRFSYSGSFGSRTEVYPRLDIDLARNIDYKRVGNDIYVINSSGARTKLFLPKSCSDVFRI